MSSFRGVRKSRLANRAVNGLFASACVPDYVFFQARLTACRRIQERKLLGYLEKNHKTLFGRKYNFAGLRSIRAYQERVPISDYEHYRPFVDRLAEGEKRVLTEERVLLLEPTGGSRSGSKRIPYTRTLKMEFQAALHAWVFDLYSAFPGLLGSKSYWSITPVATEKAYTTSGIPIGFEDDADYLGVLGRVLKSIFPVPAEVKHVRILENYRHLTALFLLRAHDLGLISVWNPTFLILLVQYLEEHLEHMLRDIFDGRVSLPVPEDGVFLTTGLQPLPTRARSIETAFEASRNHRYREIWPDLCVISCWADGISRSYAEKMATMFPGVHIQPKGLLATECVVSFPMEGPGGCVVAYPSHFFEFLPAVGANPHLLHELEPGQTYTVVVTTGGGLYRYNLQDQVEVTGSYRGLPMIRFRSRRSVSDLVGEKLEESHVQAAVEGALREDGLVFDFLLLAPEVNPSGGFYTLFIEPGTTFPPHRQKGVLREIDRRFMENVQYRYARELGQLLRPRILLLEKGQGHKAYIRRCLESGQRLGDIKQTLLDHRTGWTGWFAEGREERSPHKGDADGKWAEQPHHPDARGV